MQKPDLLLSSQHLIAILTYACLSEHIFVMLRVIFVMLSAAKNLKPLKQLCLDFPEEKVRRRGHILPQRELSR